MCRIIYIVILCLFASQIEAATIRDMEINSQMSCIIYFDSIPKYNYLLSSDKKSLTLNLIGTKSESTNAQLHSAGLINEVYIQSSGNNSVLLINLTEKSGFNIIPLYYSNAIKFDFFSWTKLSPAEDKFRTSMLGYEDELLQITSEGLKEASRDSVYEALSYLGIVLLKQGKINSAIKTLENAIERIPSNYDSYSALSQAYFIKNDTANFNKYKQIFLQKSGLLNLNFIQIDSIVEFNSNITEDLSFLHILKKFTTENDSLFNKKFENVFSQEDSTLSSKTTNELLPFWFDYVIWIIAAISLLLVYFYLRWRQNQVKRKKNSKKQPKNINKDTISSNNKIKFDRNSFINRYKESIDQSSQIENETESEENTLTYDDKEENEAINNALQAIKDKQKETKNLTNDKDAKDAKLLLAMHLSDEQSKIRSNEIKVFSDNVKNADLDKLNKIARKLGIEKGVEENANKFKQINSDKEAISKLAKKFGKKI